MVIIFVIIIITIIIIAVTVLKRVSMSEFKNIAPARVRTISKSEQYYTYLLIVNTVFHFPVLLQQQPQK